MSGRAPIHILAGSWPPMRGGLADHSRLLAEGLAERGYDVHVWAPTAASTASAPGVTVHACAERWSPSELRAVAASLDRMPSPRRLVVQWVPHDFGYRALNVALPAWLLRRAARGDRVYPLVHEPGLPLRIERPRIFAGALVHRLMAALLLRAAADRVWITVPLWEQRLRRYAPGRRLVWEWLPVPSNIPCTGDTEARDAVRRRLAPAGELLVGSFGLHGGPSTPPLAHALARLLRADGRIGVVIGPEGERVREAVGSHDSTAAARLRVVGALAAADVSAHLAACDVLVQPYVDGVSARRGSAMAVIAHGRPLATTHGPATEPVWTEEGAAALAPIDPDALALMAEGLLADPGVRTAQGARGLACYRRHFAADHMVERVAAGLGPP